MYTDTDADFNAIGNKNRRNREKTENKTTTESKRMQHTLYYFIHIIIRVFVVY